MCDYHRLPTNGASPRSNVNLKLGCGHTRGMLEKQLAKSRIKGQLTPGVGVFPHVLKWLS